MRADKNTSKNGHSSPKSRPRTGVIVALLAIAFFLMLAIGAYVVFTTYSSKLNRIDAGSQSVAVTPSPTPDTELTEKESAVLVDADAELKKNLAAGSDKDFNSKDVTNILLIGVDNDYLGGMDQLGNADGILLVSINKETEQVVLTSFMRDSYVSAAGKDYNTKLTLTYHYGGIPLLIDTIEANFGVPIDNYVLVNYINVVDIVDAFGGLDMELNESELYYTQQKMDNVNDLTGQERGANSLEGVQPGLVHLNGTQVAALLRIRLDGGNDQGRTQRARQVVMGLKEKAVQMSFRELNDMANTILPCITTDLTQGQIFSLMLNGLRYLKYDMISSRIPYEGSYHNETIGGGAMVVMDYAANKEYLYRSIYEGALKP